MHVPAGPQGHANIKNDDAEIKMQNNRITIVGLARRDAQLIQAVATFDNRTRDSNWVVSDKPYDDASIVFVDVDSQEGQEFWERHRALGGRRLRIAISNHTQSNETALRKPLVSRQILNKLLHAQKSLAAQPSKKVRAPAPRAEATGGFMQGLRNMDDNVRRSIIGNIRRRLGIAAA